MKTQNRGRKLTYFLFRFSPEEQEAFVEYLRSPLFTNSPKLADLARGCLELGTFGGIDPLALHQQVYPDVAFDESRERYLYRRIAQLLEELMEFISFKGYQKDRHIRDYLRVREFSGRNLKKYIPEVQRKALDHFDGTASSHSLIFQYLTEKSLNEYLSQNTPRQSENRLNAVLGQLDEVYLLEKLKYGCAEMNARLAGQAPEPLLLMSEIRAVLQDENRQFSALIHAYGHAFAMLEGFIRAESGHERAFRHLREFLENQPVEAAEGLELMTSALNYAILRYYRKDLEFLSETVELYQILLKRGFLLRDGFISPHYYKNIVVVLCSLGELDWVAEFVEDYKDRISGDPDSLAYLYNKAVIAFHRKQFAETVSLLYNQINNFEHPLFRLGARVYLCRALWARQDFDTLLTVLEAFRLYLKRNEAILPVQKKQHLEFVKSLSKTCKALTGNPDRKQQLLDQVGERLEASPYRDAIPWFRDELRRLRGQK